MSRNYPVRLWLAETLNSGGTLTSPAIKLEKGDPQTLMFKGTRASGTPDFKIEFAISNDGETFGSFNSADPLVTSTNTEFTANPQEFHQVNVPWAPWIKIKITEVASLNTNLITADLWVEEL